VNLSLAASKSASARFIAASVSCEHFLGRRQPAVQFRKLANRLPAFPRPSATQ
jgi:hypothetical protein